MSNFTQNQQVKSIKGEKVWFIQTFNRFGNLVSSDWAPYFEECPVPGFQTYKTAKAAIAAGREA